MAVRIREAVPGDARAIAEIHVRSWQHAYRGQLTDEYLDGLKVEDRLERHRQSLEQPPADYRMWLAEQGGEVIGFACTGKSGDADADERTAELYAIYLTPDRIGTGVGRELLDHAVADLTDRGFRTATLWVLRTNEVAHRFYEGTGWATDGTTSAERVDREMRPTVRYRRDLA